MSNVYSLSEVCKKKMVGFNSYRTVKNLIDSGQLKAVCYKTGKDGRKLYLIKEESINEFLNNSCN